MAFVEFIFVDGVFIDGVFIDMVFVDRVVTKMASHAIFQYNVLVIDIDNITLGLI